MVKGFKGFVNVMHILNKKDYMVRNHYKLQNPQRKGCLYLIEKTDWQDCSTICDGFIGSACVLCRITSVFKEFPFPRSRHLQRILLSIRSSKCV